MSRLESFHWLLPALFRHASLPVGGDLLNFPTTLLTRPKTSRPGILVLINDADWELEGEAAYLLQSGDEVVFVSTLHGG